LSLTKFISVKFMDKSPQQQYEGNTKISRVLEPYKSRSQSFRPLLSYFKNSSDKLPQYPVTSSVHDSGCSRSVICITKIWAKNKNLIIQSASLSFCDSSRSNWNSSDSV
jgi:hypothetical protein